MSDGIYGNRFAGFREPAWHKLGHVFYQPLRVSEAMRLAGLDYTVRTYQPSVTIPDERDPLSSITIPTGDVVIVRLPNDRDPFPAVFGTASRAYTPIQNLELAEILEPLAERWPVETVGALGEGERIFITLSVGDIDVKGEQVRQFFLVSDSKTPKGGFNVATVPTRVVCQNTLSLALDSADIRVDLRHTGDVRTRLETTIDLVQQLQESDRAVRQALAILADARITTDQRNTIIEAAFPAPKQPSILKLADAAGMDAVRGKHREWVEQRQANYASQLTRMPRYRAATVELYDRICDEHPRISGTAWAAYNAVAELFDWADLPGFREREKTAVFGWGADAKKRAFAAAYNLAR